SLVSSDGGFGVEVAYVSERYGGPQPASSITIVANNAPPRRPITEPASRTSKTRAPTSWSAIFSSTLRGRHGHPARASTEARTARHAGTGQRQHHQHLLDLRARGCGGGLRLCRQQARRRGHHPVGGARDRP